MFKISGVSVLTVIVFTSLSAAGTLGTVESEIETLESNVARAQNERDALILSSPAGKNNALIQTKTEALEEQKKELTKRLSGLNTRPKVKYKHPSELRMDADLLNAKPDKNDTDDSPRENGPILTSPGEIKEIRSEGPAKPETVLSGEGIQGEITYSKKKKKGAPLMNQSEQSEIQYPKKKRK